MTFFSLPLIFLLLYLFEIIHYGTKQKLKSRSKKVIFQQKLYKVSTAIYFCGTSLAE